MNYRNRNCCNDVMGIQNRYRCPQEVRGIQDRNCFCPEQIKGIQDICDHDEVRGIMDRKCPCRDDVMGIMDRDCYRR